MTQREDNVLLNALWTARPIFLWVGLFSFFINSLLLLVPLYSMQVLDRVLTTGSMETLTWLSVIMIGAFFIASLLQMFRSFALIRVSEWLDDHLSKTLLASSLTSAAAFSNTKGMQNIRDLLVVKNFLSGNGLMTLYDAPWAVIYIMVCFLIHPIIGVIALIGCIVLVGFGALNEMAMRAPLDTASEAHQRNMQQMDIAMRNAEIIEGMGMRETICNRWMRDNRKIASLQAQASLRSAVLQSFAKFTRLVLQIAVIGCGAWLVLQHQLTAGAIIATSILTARAFSPFEAAISTWKNLMEARKSYGRLKKALAAMPHRDESLSLPVPTGRVSVEKLVYAAPRSNKAIIKGVSFSLEPGDRLGIIGPSAAGKSTLAKLMIGVWKPFAGVMRLDSADVYRWKRSEFGRHVGYLPQDVELFSGTVRDNIARMQENVADEAIVQAAQLACAHEMIMTLPNGYETDIGPGGIMLSAGQRQRIGLARAFFGNPKLLMLDEPDANLDEEGENALASAMGHARKRCITTVIITHRKAMLRHVNKLLLLREGAVDLFGPVQEVAAKLPSLHYLLPAARGNLPAIPVGTSHPPFKESKHAAGS
jgi:ATP-binding cassette, subfamily B, bacterial